MVSLGNKIINEVCRKQSKNHSYSVNKTKPKMMLENVKNYLEQWSKKGGFFLIVQSWSRSFMLWLFCCKLFDEVQNQSNEIVAKSDNAWKGIQMWLNLLDVLWTIRNSHLCFHLEGYSNIQWLSSMVHGSENDFDHL